MKMYLIPLLMGLVAMTADFPLPTPLPQGVTIIEGRYFDGERQVDRGEIATHEGRIVCAGQVGECAAEDAERIIVADGTILPGLVDLHVHARPLYLGAFPAAGVTTVRDANNTLAMIDALKAHPQRPRVFASGPLLDGPESVLKRMSKTSASPGEHDWEEIMPVLASNPTQARAAVRGLAERGVDVIKLYDRMPNEAFTAAIAEAERLSIPVMADLGVVGTGALSAATVDSSQAAIAGVDSIEHLSGFALAYQRRNADPTAPSLDAEILDELVAEISSHNVAVVPTLTTALHFAHPEAADMEVPLADAAAETLGEHWEQRIAWTHNEEAKQRWATDYQFARALIPRLVDAGVLIGAGTDSPAAPYGVPGGGIHQELAYLVEFGLTELQALQSATRNAGRILGRDDIGVIQPGAVADLVAVAGNPLRNIRNTRDIRWVMLRGELQDMERLRAGAFEPLASAE